MNRKQRKEELQKIAEELANTPDINDAGEGHLTETERKMVEILNQIPTGYPALDEPF